MAVHIKTSDGLKQCVHKLESSPPSATQWMTKNDANESFELEALASWADYQETGGHLTGQRVRSWLITWGTAQERAFPPVFKRKESRGRKASG